jgi:D-serine dehydratase
MVCHYFDIGRIIIANQVIGSGNLRSLAKMLGDNTDLEIFCLVDSVEGLRQLGRGLATYGACRPIQVFIEIGQTGWRTGVRNDTELAAVWEEARQYTDCINIRGIEAFEGSGSSAEEVDQFALRFKQAARFLLNNWPNNNPPIVSIGGTAFLDRVLLIAKDLAPECKIMIRSGCYVTHDHGRYKVQHQQSIDRLQGIAEMPVFHQAMELWSYVQSMPESSLAFLTFGKRDTSHDLDLPIPIFALSPGQSLVNPKSVEGAKVTKLNDQHAYLQLPDSHSLMLGDMVCCGISHPCTAFDKWRVLPVVNDEYEVVDLYRTFF